jgi:hypothetical protein
VCAPGALNLFCCIACVAEVARVWCWPGICLSSELALLQA